MHFIYEAWYHALVDIYVNERKKLNTSKGITIIYFGSKRFAG